MRTALFASVLALMSATAHAETINLFAAGSLKAALLAKHGFGPGDPSK
jgi:ABC-type molybdate transport system substrate-binding protein